MSNMFFLLIAVFALWSPLASAKVFRNAYLAFEMPDHWDCNLEQTEWVCRSKDKDSKEAKEAIIILTAKEVGPSDSFQVYENYLNSPIKLKMKSQSGDQSKIIYKSKNLTVNNQPWIDGLHLGSEVPNYYTRYLATIKDTVAILVTFSAHKDFYTKYSQDFLKAVMSLQVIATKNLAGTREQGAIRPPGAETFGAPSQAMPLDIVQAGLEENQIPRKSNSIKFLGIALILMALGIFFYLRSQKKNK